jgi:hypothetical protein
MQRGQSPGRRVLTTLLLIVGISAIEAAITGKFNAQTVALALFIAGAAALGVALRGVWDELRGGSEPPDPSRGPHF